MIVPRLSALLVAVACLCCSMRAMQKPQSKTVAIQKDQFYCLPRPTAVKVPGFPVWPNVVELNRCTGGCHDVYNVFECAVIEERKFILPVYNFQQFKPSKIPMTEHTKCNCLCRVKSSDCNHTIQYYDPGSCSCKCITHTCDNKTKKWNDELCKCQCKLHPQSCIGYETKKLWSKETCQCECIAKNVELCKSKGKIMKPDTCECVCQPKPCPYGTIMDMKSCQCV